MLCYGQHGVAAVRVCLLIEKAYPDTDATPLMDY